MFRRKSVEEQRQEEFERQCRQATLEVINRRSSGGKATKKDSPSEPAAPDDGGVQLTTSAWPYETVRALNGNHITRLRSSLFYWGALISFIIGVILVSRESLGGGFLVLTLTPCLLLYPLIRLLFGGKDSIGGVVTTVIVEEFVKGEIFKAAEKSSRRKRR